MKESRLGEFEFIKHDKQRIPQEYLEGKVVVIVNVASLCGFTPQYIQLEELFQKYQKDGLVVLGYPCNQFGNQEPYDAGKTVELAKNNFGVTFPIMEKVEINGEHETPIYGYIKEQKRDQLGFKGVRWNFEKFLLNRNGEVVARFDTTVNPRDMESSIVTLLKEHQDSA